MTEGENVSAWTRPSVFDDGGADEEGRRQTAHVYLGTAMSYKIQRPF